MATQKASANEQDQVSHSVGGQEPQNSKAVGDIGDNTKASDRDAALNHGKKNPWALAGVGLELGVAIAVFSAGGWWLDGKFDTQPWLMLLGLSIGLIGGTYNIWKVGRSFF